MAKSTDPIITRPLVSGAAAPNEAPAHLAPGSLAVQPVPVPAMPFPSAQPMAPRQEPSAVFGGAAARGLATTNLSSEVRRVLPPGSVVGGRYRVDTVIGAGAMGTVYRAEHIHMRRLVAVKVLHRELRYLPEVVTRFEREAVAVARIQHPHVAEASDFGQLEDGSFYLVLEYIEGQSLRELLTQQTRLAVPRALHIARQIASALGAAHRAGVIHRDLKPENVMLVQRGGDPDFVKVLDFGIAKVAAEDAGAAPLTQFGTVFGTPEYMAPEQAQGIAIDARADLYTVGIVLYEMLSGVSPFEGDDVLVVLTRQMTEAPPPLPAWVPPAVVAVVQGLLAKVPSERMGSADELVWRLETLLGIPSGAPQPLGAGAAPEAQSQYSNALSSRQAAMSARSSRAVANTLSEAAGTEGAAPAPHSPGREVPRNQDPWAASGFPSRGELRPQRPVSLAVPVSRGPRNSWAGVPIPKTIVIGTWQIPTWALAVSLALPLGAMVGVLLFLLARWPLKAHSAGTGIVESTVNAPPLPSASAAALATISALEKRAAQGDRSALQALEGGGGSVASTAFALGAGWARAGEPLKSVRAYERALALDPTLADNAILLKDLRVAADNPDTQESVFHLAEESLGYHGPDLVYDVWNHARRKPSESPLTTRTKQLLASPGLRKAASPAARTERELRDARTCAEFRALLPQAIEHGDQRSVELLTPLRQRKLACGILRLQDCWACLRGDGQLEEAIRKCTARPAPVF